MFRRKRESGSARPGDAAPTYSDIRDMVLGLDPREVGLSPSEALPRAYGVVMDTAYENGTATLVALADGTTSLYLSSGGGTIGAGQHQAVATATHRLVAMAEQAVDQLPPVEDRSLPPQGAATIRVLTHAGQHAVTAPQEDFGKGRHELSPLFHGAHAVLTEIRRLHQERN